MKQEGSDQLISRIWNGVSKQPTTHNWAAVYSTTERLVTRILFSQAASLTLQVFLWILQAPTREVFSKRPNRACLVWAFLCLGHFNLLDFEARYGAVAM